MSGPSTKTSNICHEVFEKLSSILESGVAVANDSFSEMSEEKRFCFFMTILLGEVKEDAPPSQVINGKQLVTQKPIFWLPFYLKKRKGIPNIDHLQVCTSQTNLMYI